MNMKKTILLGSLLCAALTAAGQGAWATDDAKPAPPPAFEPGPRPCGTMPPDGRLARMAEVLGLSDAQRNRIRDLMKSERETAGPLMEKIGAYRMQLHGAAEKTPFDEAAARAAASGQTQAEAELALSRARMQSRINAVLTPEQRKLQQKLRPPMEPGPGHPPCFRGER